MNKKIKWSADALASYKKTGEEMKGKGFKAMRELKDPECSCVLTFWDSTKSTVIQQTWTDTGDVALYHTVATIQEVSQ